MAGFDYEKYGLTRPGEEAIESSESVDTQTDDTNDAYYDALTAGQRAAFDSMEPDLQKMYRENPVLTVREEGDTSPSSAGEDDDVVFVGTRRTVDVTDQIKDVAEAAEDNTYDALYPEAPSINPATTIKAKAFDFINLLFPDMPEQDAQAEFKKQSADKKKFLEEAQSVYEDIGFERDGERVLEEWDVDEEGNLTLTNSTIIPSPESTAWQRIMTNTGRNIQAQVGGLLTEGAIASESEYERSIPTFEQSSGEDFVTDMLTFGIPAVGAQRLVKGTRALAAATIVPQQVLNLTKVTAATRYLTNTLGVAFSDAVIASGEDEGFIDPAVIEKRFGMSKEDARDAALFFESMAFSGALDGIASVAGIFGGFGKRRVEGVRAFTSKDFVRNKSAQGAMMGVVNLLDPSIAKASKFNQKRKLAAMADMLSENAMLKLSAGDVEALIPSDSATAVLNGAKKYIANTRSDMRRKLSKGEFFAFVDEEAGKMALTMIEIARTRAGDPATVAAQGRTMKGFENFLDKVSVSKIPKGQSVQEALEGSINDLVSLRNSQVDDAASDVVITSVAKDQAQDAVDNSIMQVPELQKLMEGTPDVFNSKSFYDRLTKSMTGLEGSGSLLEQYKKTWDEVQAAYRSVPNVPVDLELFKSELDAALASAGPLDTSGPAIRKVLGDIEKIFKPKKIGTEEIADPLGDPRSPVSRDIMQTKDDLMEGLSEIGFQDLLKFKQSLEQSISKMPDSEARRSLEQFARHITDSDAGQLAFVANSVDSEAAEAAQTAINKFIDAKDKFENSTPMQQFSQRARVVTGKGMNTAVSGDGAMRGMPDLQKFSTTDMPGLLTSDKSGAWMRNYVTAMGGGDNAALQPMRELAEAQAQYELVQAMRSGSSDQVGQIFEVLNSNRSTLDSLNSTLVDDLQKVAKDLRTKQTELGDDFIGADDALRAAKDRLAKAENSILENFISDAFPDMPVSNPKEALTLMMTDSVDGANKIASLLDEVEKLPPAQAMAVRGAMKGAVVDSLVTEVFGATPMSVVGDAAAFNTKIGRLKNVLDRKGNDFLGGLRVMFKDDPEALQGVELALTGLMRQNVPSRIKINQAGSDTAFNQQMIDEVSDSVSAGVLLIFGYMTPAGALARNVSRGRIKEMEGLAKTVGDETLALIISNPVEFGQMVRDVSKAQSRGAKEAIARTFVETTGHGLGYQLRIDETGEEPVPLDQQMIEITGQVQEEFR